MYEKEFMMESSSKASLKMKMVGYCSGSFYAEALEKEKKRLTLYHLIWTSTDSLRQLHWSLKQH